MAEQSKNEEQESYDEPGNIGDEQNPAFIEKTDKHAWNYAADKVRGEKLADRIGNMFKKDKK